MLDQIQNVPRSATEILGDLTSLAGQLGGTDGLGSLSIASVAGRARVDSLPALERFLAEYTSTILFPCELPAVFQAAGYAARGEMRELIALDQQLRPVMARHGFADASSLVGRTQLRRLRPLRTERVIQRYLAAVDAGDAKAWHTLVFGLVLSVYSLPLRQGLVHFGHQTIAGFVDAARRHLTMTEAQSRQLVSDQVATLAMAVETTIANEAALVLIP